MIRTFAATMLALAAAAPAHAAEVYWTNWTAATLGRTDGTASGTITTPGGDVTVSYSGEVYATTTVNGTSTSGYPSYAPASTYADGTIIADAPNYHDIIAQTGGAGSGTNTITFSQPIFDPIMAIWSLGSGGDDANYTFGVDEPYTIVAGGPSAEYGGSGLVPNGSAHSVTGSEGNGSLFFNGFYSQITFTNTNFENWYGFTLGIDALASAVPEPASLAVLGLGVLALAGVRRRR